jgi:hypothetical protein
VAGQVAGGVELDPLLVVELVDHREADLELGHAGPPGVDDQLGAVLLGLQSPTVEALTRSGRSLLTST